MPDNTEEISQASLQALKSIKKILASRGRLQGNFYYAGHPKGTEGVLVVTLTARDTKGTKALAQGKKLRALISNAKFVRGVVKGAGSKLAFELHAGNGTKDHMRAGFKKAFRETELKALKALLKKAVFRKPGSDESEAVDDVADTSMAREEDLAEAQLSAAERAELKELMAEQETLERLGSLTDSLQESFLSVASAQEEVHEQIETLAEDYQRRREADPDDPALAQIRRDLAELLYVGDAPFDSLGDPMSTGTQALLETSDTLLPSDSPSGIKFRKARLSWDFAKKRTHDRLGALKAAIATEFPEATAAADRLDTVLDVFDEGLTDALDAALSATTPEDARGATRRSQQIARQYLGYLLTSQLVQHIDVNPYVEVKASDRLSASLNQIVGLIG